MTFYGLSTYDKCVKLMGVFKEKNLTEISQEELALMIAKNIGGSLIYNTVRKYLTVMTGFRMVEKISKDTYKIHYEVLDD